MRCETKSLNSDCLEAKILKSVIEEINKDRGGSDTNLMNVLVNVKISILKNILDLEKNEQLIWLCESHVKESIGFRVITEDELKKLDHTIEV